jgi:DNA-binding response OmpR family regulator
LIKILLVDDEPAMARGLARALLLRRPDYSVQTADSAGEAIRMLEHELFDLVITDLQMPDINGFALLAWLITNRTDVLVFAMSGHCEETTQQRLQALGSIECFAKPLDIDALLARLAESLAQRIRGHVDNVGLASFVQLMELEQKTCMLEVRHAQHVGRLYLRKGELIDASTGVVTGEAAALAILGWINVDLTIEASCNPPERTIWRPAHYVIMEAMRLDDERSRKPAACGPDDAPAAPLDALADKSGSEHMLLPSRPVAPRGSLEALHMPVGTLALLIADMNTGLVLASADAARHDLGELARTAHAIVQQQSATFSLAVGSREQLEELVVMMSRRGEIIRTLPTGDKFVLLVFDVDQTNLVMARHELSRFLGEYAASMRA